jgi:hypothetical protein
LRRAMESSCSIVAGFGNQIKLLKSAKPGYETASKRRRHETGS